MMNYRTKRKLIVNSLFLVVILFTIYIIYSKYFKENPTCFDNIKNGIEEGVDCGGKCEKICDFRAEKINVLWARPFKVADGIFNIVALIENPNFNYQVDVDYKIRYWNENGINIDEKKNKITILPSEKKIIFIPNVVLKGQTINKVSFIQDKVYNIKENKNITRKIIVNSKELIFENYVTKLKIILENTDYITKNNIEISAVLYNKDENAVNVNRTYLDVLQKDSRGEVIMTWPSKIEEKITRIEVYINEIEDAFLSI